LIFGVKQFEDHCAAHFETLQATESFGDQETLHRVFLSIKIGTEIEAAVGRVKISLAA
jgi:hypothetical protein